VMFLVWQFFVGNLLSVVLVLFPDTFVNFCVQFQWCRCVHTLSCLIMYSFLARVGHPDIRWSIVSSYSLHSRHLLLISCFKFFS
jgi:hypothetical protein